MFDCNDQIKYHYRCIPRDVDGLARELQTSAGARGTYRRRR